MFDENGNLRANAAAIIRKKARSLRGKYGFNESDVEDIEQEIVIDLWKRRNRFNPGRSHENYFIVMVARHAIARIIERAKADMRRVHTRTRSLDQPVDDRSDESPLLHETLTEEDHLPRLRDRSRSPEDERDLVLDLEAGISTLPGELRHIARLLKFYSMSEISRKTGIPRTTLNDKRMQIRKALEGRGLGEYLH